MHVVQTRSPLGERGASFQLLVFVIKAGAQSAAGRRDLSAQEEHRHGIGERAGERRGGIEDAGTTYGQANARLAAGARVAIGHEGSRLLIASQNMANARLAIERVVDRRELAAGIAKHMLDSVVRQGAHEHFGAGSRRFAWLHADSLQDVASAKR